MQRTAPLGVCPAAPRERAADPSSQSPGGVDERVLLGVALLAEQVHLVAEPHERRGEAGVVDVRARPAEQIAVEDQDAHGPHLP